MTQQQISNRAFAKMLATSFFGTGIDKLPFPISSQQYVYLKQEWNKLKQLRNKIKNKC
jgi:hypothetical protein